jgi:hypothetical protein
MKTPFAKKLGKRRRVLLLVVVLLAVLAAILLFGSGVSEWPLPGNLQREEATVRQLRDELARLRKEEATNQRWLETLRQKARPIWHIKGDKLPSVEVQNELEKVAQRAQVSIQSLGAPRTSKLAENISGIELSLHIVGSMRDVGRFLTEVEKNTPGFCWVSCSLRPDNPRTPHGVILDGRIQALALSPEAQKSLFGEKGIAP